MLLCHDVYFTLADRSEAATDALIAACKKYLTVQPGIVFFCCGRVEPELAREVNVRDFDVALHVVFTDRAAHDAYQGHPVHDRFREECGSLWTAVRIYDSVDP